MLVEDVIEYLVEQVFVGRVWKSSERHAHTQYILYTHTHTHTHTIHLYAETVLFVIVQYTHTHSTSLRRDGHTHSPSHLWTIEDGLQGGGLNVFVWCFRTFGSIIVQECLTSLVCC
jgi:hypothetical protein